MSASLRIGWRLLGAQGRSGRRDLLLTAVGVAVPVALLVIVAGVLVGLDRRDDRMAWREPTAARSEGWFLQQRSGDAFGSDPIDRVDLAAARGRSPADLPAPPGLERFPAPGEVYLSPALAALVRANPDAELADRYLGPGARLQGTIASDGLARPDELVAVVGRPASVLEASLVAANATEASPYGAPSMGDRRAVGPYRPSEVVAAERFASTGSDPGLIAVVSALAVIGAVLLAVPAVQLSAAAARFTTNRRAQRLAALRLAGAGPGQVVVIASVESAVASGLGAVAGAALGWGLLPLLARVPMAGGRWYGTDLWPGPGAVALIVVGTLAVNMISVAATLRRVVRAPLGVITSQRRRHPTGLRLVLAAGLWAVFLATMLQARDSGSTWPMGLGMAAVLASLAVVGPWLTWVMGAGLARLARRTPALLAGRRLAADPSGAFRPVAGIVLVGFVAGMVLTLLPLSQGRPGDQLERTTLELEAPWRGDEGGWTTTEEADIEARVGRLAVAPIETDGGWLRVRVAEEDVERARTALAGLVPATPALTIVDDDWFTRTLLGDLTRAAAVATLSMIVLALFATALSAAADILEQRATLRALCLAGTEVSVLQRARRLQSTMPLAAATIGSVASGAGAGLVLLLGFGRDTAQLPQVPVGTLLLVMAAGPIAGLVAAASTRLLLRSAVEHP